MTQRTDGIFSVAYFTSDEFVELFQMSVIRFAGGLQRKKGSNRFRSWKWLAIGAQQ